MDCVPKFHALRRRLESKISERGGADALYVEGWLLVTKQGVGPALFNKGGEALSWCVLTADGTLTFYSSPDSNQCLGVVSVRLAKINFKPTTGKRQWVRPGGGGRAGWGVATARGGFGREAGPVGATSEVPEAAANPSAVLTVTPSGSGKRSYRLEASTEGEANDWLQTLLVAAGCPRGIPRGGLLSGAKTPGGPKEAPHLSRQSGGSKGSTPKASLSASGSGSSFAIEPEENVAFRALMPLRNSMYMSGGSRAALVLSTSGGEDDDADARRELRAAEAAADAHNARRQMPANREWAAMRIQEGLRQKTARRRGVVMIEAPASSPPTTNPPVMIGGVGRATSPADGVGWSADAREASIVKAGWLHKEGPAGALLSSRDRQRWCELHRGGVLKYYLEPGGPVRGMCNLVRSHVAIGPPLRIEILPHKASTVPGKAASWISRKLLRERYVFEADKPAAASSWHQAFMQASRLQLPTRG
jgi:hypothetical protein